ncbi:30S ribosomal protein S6, partial [Candidatus Curtissbacteria bacterium]|nr:30S ribosomal protein S6 [Candidatus Curtissbacteria bacterium]
MLYELMLIASPKADSKNLIGEVEKTIKNADGSAVKVENLGKKNLAYPIVKEDEGEYFVFNFEAPPDAVKKISDKLRLEREALLRYLIIKSQVGKREKRVRVQEPTPQPPKVTVKTVTTTKGKKSKEKVPKAVTKT